MCLKGMVEKIKGPENSSFKKPPQEFKNDFLVEQDL